jgi:fimbrial chaperone protein
MIKIPTLQSLFLAFLIAEMTVFPIDRAMADVAPMRIVLDVEDERPSFVVRVTNPSSSPLPVEMSVGRRFVDTNGTQTIEVVEDAFMIFPPMAYIPAGGVRTVRATYMGDLEMAESLAYILFVKEVPLPPEPGFNGVVFAHNFGVAVYLRAPGSRAGPFAADMDDAGNLVISNTGRDYALVTDLGIRFLGDESRRPRPAGELITAGQNPIIPPGASRVFYLQEPIAPDDEPPGLRVMLLRAR